MLKIHPKVPHDNNKGLPLCCCNSLKFWHKIMSSCGFKFQYISLQMRICFLKEKNLLRVSVQRLCELKGIIGFEDSVPHTQVHIIWRWNWTDSSCCSDELEQQLIYTAAGKSRIISKCEVRRACSILWMEVRLYLRVVVVVWHDTRPLWWDGLIINRRLDDCSIQLFCSALLDCKDRWWFWRQLKPEVVLSSQSNQLLCEQHV